MDIRTEQLEALLKQQEFQSKKSTTAKTGEVGGFEATLQQEVALGGVENSVQNGQALTGVQTSLVNQMLIANAENVSAQSADSMTESMAFDYAATTMEMLDNYTKNLREPGQGNLREAYAALDDIASHVQTLKQKSGSLLEQNSDLADIVNELEVLTTTEKFKFNRGDYST